MMDDGYDVWFMVVWHGKAMSIDCVAFFGRHSLCPLIGS